MGPEKPPAVDDHNQSEVKKLNGYPDPESGVMQVWLVESRWVKKDPIRNWRECLSLSVQVRSISLNVRKNVSLNTLSQDVLLKEFSTISWNAHAIHSATHVCVWTRTKTLYRYQTCLHLGSSSAPPAVNWPSDLSLLDTLTGWKRAEISPDLPSLWPFVCL